MINEFKKRRSIRKYKDKPVEKNKLDLILENALISPTSRNRKPWEFILITDKNILLKLSQSKQHGSSFAKDAPAAIVIISDKDKSDVWIEDTTIAAYTIQLSAFILGLGTCWIQVRNRMKSDSESTEDFLRKALNIPENYHVECIISIGYNDEDKEEYTKNNMDFSKIHYNTF
ncbi:MAG: nitroreductase family protein [Eubacteriaceae bacterium]